MGNPFSRFDAMHDAKFSWFLSGSEELILIKFDVSRFDTYLGMSLGHT